jgi:hypothetical protein
MLQPVMLDSRQTISSFFSWIKEFTGIKIPKDLMREKNGLKPPSPKNKLTIMLVILPGI